MSSGGKQGQPVGPQVSIAMIPDMLARIDAAAARAGVSRAEWVRRACAAALGSTMAVDANKRPATPESDGALCCRRSGCHEPRQVDRSVSDAATA